MIERAKEEDRGCSFSPLPARIKVRMCRSSRHNSERSSVKDVLLCDIYLSSSYPLRSPRNTTMLIYLVSCSIPSSCQFFNFVASTDFSNFPNFRLSARRPFMQKKLAKEKGGAKFMRTVKQSQLWYHTLNRSSEKFFQMLFQSSQENICQTLFEKVLQIKLVPFQGGCLVMMFRFV